MNTFENINTLFKAFTDKFGPIVAKRCHEFTPADFEHFASLLDKYCEVKDEASDAVKPTDTVTPDNTVPNEIVEQEPIEDPIEIKKRLRQSRPRWLKLDTLVTHVYNGSTIVGTIEDTREYINVKKKVAKFYALVKWFTKASDIENHVMTPPNVLEAHHLKPVFGRGCIITPENVEQLCMNLMHSSIRLADTSTLDTKYYNENICSTEIMAIKDLEYHLNKTTCDLDNILINGIYLDMLLECDPYIHIKGMHWEKLMKYIMQTVKSFNPPA